MVRNFVIDGQILQTTAWHRGMGKYTLQLARSIDNLSKGQIKVFIIFNENLSSPKARFDELQRLCPRIEQLHYKLPIPDNLGARAELYRTVLENYLKKDIPKGDNFYLITSLFTFEFFADFPNGYRRLLLFYDLIPLLFWQDLGKLFPPKLYMGRFQEILDAECILTISSTSRNDLLKVFGLDPQKVININGGFLESSGVPKMPMGFEVPQEYILFPTGDMPHKNNALAIKGYLEYCRRTDSPIPLLLTSFFTKESKQNLCLLSRGTRIIFTDNVADAELEWLYDNAAVVLFASRYEGLGLPILDAVAKGKPVVASHIPVFEEMAKDAFYYFDVEDSSALATALGTALKDQNFNIKQSQYAKILDKYTWQNTGNATLNAIAGMRHIAKPDSYPHKPRIAVLSAYPGLESLGRYAEIINTDLSEDYKVDYYFETDNPNMEEIERPSFLDFIDAATFPIKLFDFRLYRKYEMVIYLLDEYSFPSRLAEIACALPGYVIIDSDGVNKDPSYKIIKELALRNHYKVENAYSSTGKFVWYQGMAKSVSRVINRRETHPLEEDVLIRRTTNNKNLVRKLKQAIRGLEAH